MVHRTAQSVFKGIAAASLLALASHANAAPEVVWVDNENFDFTSCSSDGASRASADPMELMRALRERGLTDAGQSVKLSGLSPSLVTLTPISASWHCDGTSSTMVFRLSAIDRASGQAWTSNLVSHLAAPVRLSAATPSSR